MGEDILLAHSLLSSQMQESGNGGLEFQWAKAPPSPCLQPTPASQHTGLSHLPYLCVLLEHALWVPIVFLGSLHLCFPLNLQKSGKIYRKWSFEDIERSHLVFPGSLPDSAMVP